MTHDDEPRSAFVGPETRSFPRALIAIVSHVLQYPQVQGIIGQSPLAHSPHASGY